MGSMSFGATTELKMRIPPLSSFTFGGEPVAGASVEVDERIGQAEDIPLNYHTPSAYLMVRKGSGMLYMDLHSPHG